MDGSGSKHMSLLKKLRKGKDKIRSLMKGKGKKSRVTVEPETVATNEELLANPYHPNSTSTDGTLGTQSDTNTPAVSPDTATPDMHSSTADMFSTGTTGMGGKEMRGNTEHNPGVPSLEQIQAMAQSDKTHDLKIAKSSGIISDERFRNFSGERG